MRGVIERLAKFLPRKETLYSAFDGDRDGRAAWLDAEIFGELPRPADMPNR
jgi:hypothetical protein